MIQPKELRIGNLIKHNNREYVVNGLNKRRIELTSSDNIVFSTSRLDLIEPIPTTEDVLLKAGFESTGVCFKIKKNDFEVTMFYYDCWRLSYFSENDPESCSGDLVGFWPVHELQNLFHALTGEELIINLK